MGRRRLGLMRGRSAGCQPTAPATLSSVIGRSVMRRGGRRAAWWGRGAVRRFPQVGRDGVARIGGFAYGAGAAPDVRSRESPWLCSSLRRRPRRAATARLRAWWRRRPRTWSRRWMSRCAPRYGARASFADAYLETTTDPNLVHELIAKLDYAGIYTDDEADQCAEAWVTQKGNSALAAAIGPGKQRFQQRYQTAITTDDKAEIEALDMFRKDVGSFVRLYDFMSQIFDYGDPDLEKKQIYLRLLERRIQPGNYTAPIDLSDVVLKKVKQVDKGKQDLSLGDDRVGLKGMTGVGSGTKKDPKMIAFEAVLDRLNEMFGSEEFNDGQKRTFLEALVETIRENKALWQQAKVNEPHQFAESPDFHDAVIGAAADNHDAHGKMAECLYGGGRQVTALFAELARLVSELAKGEDE